MERESARGRNAGDHAYEEIKSLILSQGLRPGERTSVAMLAERVNRGKSPVKEAITRLAAEGMLVVSERRGTYVQKLTRRDIVELFELRRLLEGYAADHITHISDAEEARLEELLGTMAGESSQNSRGEHSVLHFVDADVAFHTGIVNAAGNERLSSIYASLDLHLQIALFLVRQRDGFSSERHKEHIEIMQAIRNRSAATLKHLLQVHAERVQEAILLALKE